MQYEYEYTNSNYCNIFVFTFEYKQNELYAPSKKKVSGVLTTLN